MKAKQAPVYLVLCDMEQDNDSGDTETFDKDELCRLRARIARRPGRWRRGMSGTDGLKNLSFYYNHVPDAA